MEINRIITWTNPVAPFQKIYVMKDGALIEQMGVRFEDVEEIIYALSDKYNITNLHFSGSCSYAEKIVADIKNNQVRRYNKDYFNIEFV